MFWRHVMKHLSILFCKVCLYFWASRFFFFQPWNAIPWKFSHPKPCSYKEVLQGKMAPDCHLGSFFLYLFVTWVLNYYGSKNCLHSNDQSLEIKQHASSWGLASVNSSVSHYFATPMDCSPPDFSVHGIFQARILEWVAIPFSRRSSQPRGGLPPCRHILYCLSNQESLLCSRSS